MGCWNATCFMSHLPITFGDKVAMFVLGPTYPEHQLDSRCYPDDRYTPLGTPFIGEYDDYGSIENIEPNAYTESYLLDFATIYVKDGEEFVKYDWVDTGDFLRELSAQRLYVNDIMKNTKQKLSYVMIHYDLYVELMRNISNRIPYNEIDTFGVLIERDIKKVIEWLKNKRDQIDKLKLEINQFIPMFDRFSDKISIGSNNRWQSMNHFANQYIESGNEDLLEHIKDYIVWSKVMSLSRSGYHCHSGAGSQDVELMIPKIVANYIINRCEASKMEHIANGGSQDDFSLEEEILFWEADV